MRAGLQRTDNNMEFTTWPQVNMINQKNYYTCVIFPHLPSHRPWLHFIHPILAFSCFPAHPRAMVGRKVLDGLRKGKKDVYALNIQYVKRYWLLLLSPQYVPRGHCHSTPLTNRNVHSATFSNVTTKSWHCVYSKMSASTGESAPQSTLTELEPMAPQKVCHTESLSQIRMMMRTSQWTMPAQKTTDPRPLFFTLAAKTSV
jgi:hypothetical protein